ncbi:MULTISPECIES: PIN-like domain-containing protein [Bacillus]|uniref:PIN-like domain-containing protein n=1 Tax=Bacillus TaxID=1386 RepID=UPI00397C5BE6
MKEKFREFYFDKEDKNIWEESIIVIDTNVLLNLYRYTKETSDQILELLDKYKENLWMPHHVGLEYHYNRKSVILEQRGSNEKVCSAFQQIPDKIRDILNKDLSNFKKRHKDDLDSLVYEIKKVIEVKVHNLKKISEEDDLLQSDSIKSKITDLYSNRVGNPYSEEELKDIMKEADNRFNNEIPPGYKDVKNKKGIKYYNGVQIQNKYGDFILWKQVLDYAVENNTNIIFITDEKKEDWWYEAKGRIIGPRVELLNEFSNKSEKDFYMFSSIGFIEIKGGLDQSAVSEVKEISKAYQQTNLFEESNEDAIFYNVRGMRGEKFQTPFSSSFNMNEFSEEDKSELMIKFCNFIVNKLHYFNEKPLYYAELFNLLQKKFGRSYTEIILEILVNDIEIELINDVSGLIVDINSLRGYVYNEIL